VTVHDDDDDDDDDDYGGGGGGGDEGIQFYVTANLTPVIIWSPTEWTPE
jgi:hypothetical protein